MHPLLKPLRPPLWTACLCAMLLSACRGLPAPPPLWAPTPVIDDHPKREDCIPLRRSTGQIPVTATVWKPGTYCLVQDLVQRGVLDLINGSDRGALPSGLSALGVFEASNVDLDMAGHLATGRPYPNAPGFFAREPASHHVRLHNGRIDTPGPHALGIMMGAYKFPYWLGNKESLPRPGNRYSEDDPPYSEYSARMAKGPDGEYLQTPDGKQYLYGPVSKTLAPYRRTDFTVDNMSVTTGGRGVILVGTHNVLRNSTIEVDGHTAAYLYGANALVEGNTFIIHLLPGHPGELPAALKLRDADNAVIRNNRFIVKGPNGPAEVAINLLQSKNVLIENNTIERTLQLVRQDADSSFESRGNVLR